MPKRSPYRPEVIAYLRKRHPEVFELARSEVKAIESAVQAEERVRVAAGLMPFELHAEQLWGGLMAKAPKVVSLDVRATRGAQASHQKDNAARWAAIGLYGQKYAFTPVSKEKAAGLIHEELFRNSDGSYTYEFETVRKWLQGWDAERFMPSKDALYWRKYGMAPYEESCFNAGVVPDEREFRRLLVASDYRDACFNAGVVPESMGEDEGADEGASNGSIHDPFR
jgi:hypothetical protein